MDPKVAALAEMMRIWRVQESFRASTLTMILWYYMTTLKDEIRYIWPQPNRKLGKILYFTARISFVLFATNLVLLEFPTHIHLGVRACNVMSNLDAVLSRLTFGAAEATLSMCLYALLHGKKKYFIYLVIVFLLYQAAYLALNFTARSIEGIHAVEQTPLDVALGYSCSWDWAVSDPESQGYPISRLTTARRYLRLGMLLLIVVFAIVVLVLRYRKQNGRIIRVIRRDGGLHFLAIICFYAVSAGSSTPGLQNFDVYGIVNSAMYLSFIFTDRLLLQLQSSDDPGTQHFISKIVFKEIRNRAPNHDSLDSEWVDDENELGRRGYSTSSMGAGFESSQTQGTHSHYHGHSVVVIGRDK